MAARITLITQHPEYLPEFRVKWKMSG